MISSSRRWAVCRRRITGNASFSRMFEKGSNDYRILRSHPQASDVAIFADEFLETEQTTSGRSEQRA